MSKAPTPQNQNVIIPAAKRNQTNKTPYVRKRKGIPLPDGCTFQDLSTEQRKEIMDNGEIAWKKEYNKKKSTIRVASFEVTRG